MFPQNFEYRVRFLANEWAAVLSPLLFAFGLEKLLNYDSAFSLFSFFFATEQLRFSSARK